MNVYQDDIAVIGIACIFPEAPDLATFWENILAGRCSISDHPAPEADRVLDSESSDFERVYTRRGGFLGDLATFDPVEFGVMPDSVHGGDPDHFMALRVAKEALDDAGLLDGSFPRDRTDVIIGHGTYVNPGNVNWIQHGIMLDQTVDLVASMIPGSTEQDLRRVREDLRAALPPMNAQTIPGVIPNILAGRIANRFDLMGANYLVDAACASSLIAVDHGVKNLLLGRCDVVLVGGVQACVPPPILMLFCQLGALSRQPALCPLSANADGTMLGEGVGMMVLKRRKDAEKDGDRVYAVVKGIGIASDGRSKGLLAPRMDGESLAIRRAYDVANVTPESVGLVEAHATGISLGDATEILALQEVFGPRNGSMPTCALGSVKSMIGHCIPAAGMASLIKVVMGLNQKILPPTANCVEPNEALDRQTSRFYVNTESRPWVHPSGGTPRRGAVSSMGFGGINSHCVVEEAE